MEEPAVELPLLTGQSFKPQATSFKLDMAVGYDRMNLERNNYGQ